MEATRNADGSVTVTVPQEMINNVQFALWLGKRDEARLSPFTEAEQRACQALWSAFISA